MKFPKIFALVKFSVENTITHRVITQKSPVLESTFSHMYHVWKKTNVLIFFGSIHTRLLLQPGTKSYFQEFNFHVSVSRNVREVFVLLPGEP
jgi:hypothetical protein